MDIGFKNSLWLQATNASAHAQAIGDESGIAPEWLELRERLGATWSARRELGLGERSSAERRGSFDHSSACALARFDAASPAVNPIALGNLKPLWGNAGEHAGEHSPGGRG